MYVALHSKTFLFMFHVNDSVTKEHPTFETTFNSGCVFFVVGGSLERQSPLELILGHVSCSAV